MQTSSVTIDHDLLHAIILLTYVQWESLTLIQSGYNF